MIEYNPKSWVSVLAQTHGSILPQLWTRIVAAAALGGIAVYAHSLYRFTIPPTAHTLVGAALGLLLVFRTNASYDRYWEGRKLLGTLVNRSRDLMRQVAAYLQSPEVEAAEQCAELRRRVLLLYALIQQRLRGEHDLAALGALVTFEEKRTLEGVTVRPLVVATWISKQFAWSFQKGYLHPQALLLLDANLTALIDAWGGSDRIRTTPIPFAYAHHIKGFLALFCFTVPFAMVDTMGYTTPVAAAIVAYGLFGIEEIGVEIEEPFGDDPNDLPLEAIGKALENDTAQVLAFRDP